MASRDVPAPVLDIFPPEPSTAASPAVAPAQSASSDAGHAQLASGRTLEWQAGDGGAEHVRVRGVSGEIELDVVLGEDGPRLRLKAAALALEAEGRVEVECDEFHVRAKSNIVHEAGGNMGENVAGNAVTVVGGDLRMTARTAGMRASRGDVRLKANDDVKLEGERIKLNC
jgi:hypothetical protein